MLTRYKQRCKTYAHTFTATLCSATIQPLHFSFPRLNLWGLTRPWVVMFMAEDSCSSYSSAVHFVLLLFKDSCLSLALINNFKACVGACMGLGVVTNWRACAPVFPAYAISYLVLFHSFLTYYHSAIFILFILLIDCRATLLPPLMQFFFHIVGHCIWIKYRRWGGNTTQTRAQSNTCHPVLLHFVSALLNDLSIALLPPLPSLVIILDRNTLLMPQWGR